MHRGRELEGLPGSMTRRGGIPYRTGAMSSRRAVLAVVVAFLLVNIAFLGVRPVLSPDEARYGSIAVQMAESGDWLSMRMSGFRFYEKPALVYWMMAASVDLLGANAFAIRLPAALCGGIAAAAMGIAARRGARLAGVAPADATATGALVALCSLTMVLPTVGSSVAILDQPIAAFVTLSTALFFLGATEPPGRRRFGWLVAAGVAAGLGFMTKGLLAFAFPAVTVVPWLLWERRWRDAIVLPLVPIAVAAVFFAPWAIAVHRAEPGFWERFIIHEHFRRFAGSEASQPKGSWALYLWLVPLGCFPWIMMAPQAARRWPSLARTSTGIRFAACAVIGPLVFLSLSRGKLPTYSLPLYPPIAWLLIAGLESAFAAGSSREGRPYGRFLAGGILLALGAVAFTLALGGERSRPWLERAWLSEPHGRAALLGVALVAWGLMDWQARRATDGRRRLLWMGLAPVLPLASFSLLLPHAAVSEVHFPGEMLERERVVIDSAPTLLCDYRMAHACAWTLGRTDFSLVGDAREFDNGLGIPEEQARIVPDAEVAARITAGRVIGQVAMAMSTQGPDLDRLLSMPGMPPPTRRIDHRGWSLVLFEAAR